MSFDEFSKHGLTILSMIYYSKRVKETFLSCHSMSPVVSMGLLYLICLSKLSGLRRLFVFSKHWLTILSMFEFSKRLEETIFVSCHSTSSVNISLLCLVCLSFVSGLRRQFFDVIR